MRRLLVLLSLLCATTCRAALPGWSQHLGARLPQGVVLVDEAGRAAPLARWFGAGAVVLVLGYYNCPNMCGATMQDLLAAATDAGLPPDAFRLLAVSIDPSEDAGVAARKAASYRRELAGTGIRIDLLTGAAAQTERLARAAGFTWVRDPQRGLMHPAGFVVAAPDGTIARYFLGSHVDARDLRLALVQASRGQVGTLSDRIALVCSHFDPVTGRYSGAAMALVRAAGVLTMALLAALVITARRRGRRA